VPVLPVTFFLKTNIPKETIIFLVTLPLRLVTRAHCLIEVFVPVAEVVFFKFSTPVPQWYLEFLGAEINRLSTFNSLNSCLLSIP